MSRVWLTIICIIILILALGGYIYTSNKKTDALLSQHNATNNPITKIIVSNPTGSPSATLSPTPNLSITLTPMPTSSPVINIYVNATATPTNPTVSPTPTSTP